MSNKPFDDPPAYSGGPQAPQAAYHGGYQQSYQHGPPGPGGYYQPGPQMGYYPQQQGYGPGGYPPQGGYPPHGGYPPQGYYQDQRGGPGCLEVMLASLACCCCLECLLF